MRPARGFALITVLWVIAVGSIVATAAALAGRNAVNATRNRTQLDRAFWVASGCAARAHSAIDSALHRTATYEDAATLWRVLDRVVALTAPSGDECQFAFEAAGTRLDVNLASAEMLAELFRTLGVGQNPTALGDTVVARRTRRGELADIRQLGRFADFSVLDTVLAVEPGRVSLATAPVTVLVSIPGITPETAERIVALRAAGAPVTDVMTLAGSVSRPSADALIAHYSEVARLTTPDPDAWILTVAGCSGMPRSTAVIEWRLVRHGRRAVVVRTRTGMQ